MTLSMMKPSKKHSMNWTQKFALLLKHSVAMNFALLNHISFILQQYRTLGIA